MRNQISKILVWVIVALHLTVLYPSPSPTHAQDDQERWLLDRINQLRSGLGLHGYAWNNQLAAAAQQQSDYMAATLDISHDHPDGSTPQSRAAANGYGGSWVSENIYWGTGATAETAFTWWSNSPVHYAGMTHSRNNEIGVGVTVTDNGGFYTLVFGYRAGITAPNVPIQPPSSGQTAPTQALIPNNPQVVSAPPIRRPPPTLTFTPSPTIPTLTPTITWTPTSTWTLPPTATALPPSSTPYALPTAIAMADSPTLTLFAVNNQPIAPQSNSRQESSSIESDSDIPIGLVALLAIQGVLIGAGVYFVFFRPSPKP